MDLTVEGITLMLQILLIVRCHNFVLSIMWCYFSLSLIDSNPQQAVLPKSADGASDRSLKFYLKMERSPTKRGIGCLEDSSFLLPYLQTHSLCREVEEFRCQLICFREYRCQLICYTCKKGHIHTISPHFPWFLASLHTCNTHAVPSRRSAMQYKVVHYEYTALYWSLFLLFNNAVQAKFIVLFRGVHTPLWKNVHRKNT